MMVLGYRIVYGGDEPANFCDKSTGRLRTMVAVMFLMFSLIVRLSWPEGAEQLRTYLLPGVQTVTEQAFNQLCSDLRQGEPVAYAVEAFCSRIINESSEN